MSLVPTGVLRFWPLVIIAIVQIAATLYSITPEFDNFTRFLAMMAGPLLCLILFLVYWTAFSRAPKRERIMVPVLSIAAAIGVALFAENTARPAMWIYGLPAVLLLAIVIVALHRNVVSSARLPLLLLVGVFGWIPFLFVRLDGFDGGYLPEFAYRWAPTHEEEVLRQRGNVSDLASSPVVAKPGDWSGFRGPNRDSRVTGARINADWETAPPKLLWKIPVGPAWSSFTIVGDAAFTQEQFGEDEGVTCYDLATGKERWRHTDRARFNEVVAGPGPRATPTFFEDKIYAMGAMANFNCLDATTGKVIWTHDLMKELNGKVPEWGFASSPLLIAGVAIVYANSEDGQGLVAYDAHTGKAAWHAPAKGSNFGSAQRAVFAGKECVLFTNEAELLALEPATGEILWRFAPSGYSMPPYIQPQQVGPDSLVVALGDGTGVARLEVAYAEKNWSVKQAWTSKSLKPSFNDFILHKNALFGFDQNIFAAIDAETGKKLWKKGRYGFGQAIFFEEQALLVVITETGDLVLLAADPNEPKELARVEAIQGKTWNHPAYAHGKLIVRSGQEAACFDLTPSETPAPTEPNSTPSENVEKPTP